jgi:hypothetical protein
MERVASKMTRKRTKNKIKVMTILGKNVTVSLRDLDRR